MRKDNAFGVLCKIGIGVWTVFVGYYACASMVGITDTTPDDAQAGAKMVGSLAAHFALWIVPTGFGALMYAIFGRSDVKPKQ